MRVEYPEDEEANGLSAMIGGLIEANLGTHPDRARLLEPPAVVAIVARDAEVACTVRLSPVGISVANGLRGRPAVVVRADTTTLTDLTTAPLRLGYPDVLSRPGRGVAAKLVTGELTVRGLFRHPVLVSRLTRLLSVA